MVNLYKCENCGTETQIPDNSPDNQLADSMGYVAIPHCGHCVDFGYDAEVVNSTGQGVGSELQKRLEGE